MATPLGGSGYTGLVIPVISTETSNTIQRGMVCAIAVTANNPAATFLGSGATINKDFGSGTMNIADIPLMQVQRGAVDVTTINTFVNVGIAKDAILPGKVGEIIMLGLARVLPTAAIGVGEVISSAAAGKVIDAVSASHYNPFGVMLETVSAGDATAGTLRWAFVNFLLAFGNGAQGAAYSQALRFMGKTF